MRSMPSWTAAWVATSRGLAVHLPPEGRLVDDPLGASFAEGKFGWLVRTSPQFAARLTERFVLYMQVRTRLIDDVVARFIADGGRQVVLLGAGFDTRAARFIAPRFFEIDHPSTQAKKRAIVGEPPRVTYLPWDFEATDDGELPGALQAVGHRPNLPTLTIWEGVTMYLTLPAIEASLRATAAWSAPGSILVMTYLHRANFDQPDCRHRWMHRVVERVGEPVTTAFHPDDLKGWAAGLGFDVVADEATDDAARRLLPSALAKRASVRGQQIATLVRNQIDIT
jgi:methyltransferase (TIGR00027 family)